jgi:hypothetical protein
MANVSDAMGRLAAAFYEDPSQKMTLVGVTGAQQSLPSTLKLEEFLSLEEIFQVELE